MPPPDTTPSSQRPRRLVVLLSLANVAIFWLVQATRLELAHGAGNVVLVLLVEGAVIAAVLDGARSPWRVVATTALVAAISAPLIFVSILVTLAAGCVGGCD